jgi:hypothetical protein
MICKNVFATLGSTNGFFLLQLLLIIIELMLLCRTKESSSINDAALEIGQSTLCCRL